MPLVKLKDGQIARFFPGGESFEPGVPVEVSEERALELLAMVEIFDHAHDESCHHPADEATENHEEGL